MTNPFHHIAYMPVAIPQFPAAQTIVERFRPQFKGMSWNQQRLMPSYITDRQPYSQAREWSSEMQDSMGELIEFIHTELPFTKVVIAKILQSQTDLGIHVDIGKYDWCDKTFYDHQYRLAPSAYRIVLGGHSNNTLYYVAHYDTPKENRIWAQMPSDTDTFVHSAVDSLHGADYHDQTNRYILFIHGWLDEHRHLDLLERSYEKYRDYAITFDQLFEKDQHV